jgi:hypothetical protein
LKVLLLLLYPYLFAGNSSPFIEKERCREREKEAQEKRDAEIVRENPNHGWVTACGIRNGLIFPLKG